MRADGLQAEPHRPHGRAGDLRRHQAVSDLLGYQVTWVVNITDVDDKLIDESNERNMTMAQLAEEMTADYMRNLEALGVDTIDHFPEGDRQHRRDHQLTQGR